MAERWDHARVLALAPDAPSQRAAQSLASGRSWPLTGAAEPGALWGECRGSAAAPYRTVVDLAGPAYQCSCPSRKFPCKHVLALLLLWADGSVHDKAGEPPGWAASWLAGRGRKAGAAPPSESAEAQGPQDGGEARAAAGDQGRQRPGRTRPVALRPGPSGPGCQPAGGYGHWDDIAARMVDAQAPGPAERLRALASVPHSGAGWEGRLLEEYALLRLLAVAYRRQEELPAPLRETVRSRIGFSRRQADVLAHGQPVRDHWLVLARRDLEQDRIRVRRTWLQGATGGPALVLGFAAAGQALDDTLAVGTEAHATWSSTPAPSRCGPSLLAKHHVAAGSPPPGDTIAGLLGGYAVALADDPWLDSWPAVLDVTRPAPRFGPCPTRPGTPSRCTPAPATAGRCWRSLADAR